MTIKEDIPLGDPVSGKLSGLPEKPERVQEGGEESEQERRGEEAVKVGRGWRGKKEERRRNRWRM